MPFTYEEKRTSLTHQAINDGFFVKIHRATCTDPNSPDWNPVNYSVYDRSFNKTRIKRARAVEMTMEHESKI